MSINIGKLLKDLRYEKGLTLKMLSEMSGLSVSFLSQVENSKSSITLQSLSKITDALEVSRSYFFPDETQTTNSYIRKKNEGQINFNQSNFIYQSLSNLSNPLFEPMLVILLPDDQQTNSSSTHKGQEFVYVLEGTLTLLHEGVKHELVPGESFHMESSTPHTWFNETDRIVKIVYVYSSI